MLLQILKQENASVSQHFHDPGLEQAELHLAAPTEIAVNMEGVWMLAVAVMVRSCWSPLLVNAQEGVGLTLNGVSYFNNSLVNINDIGNGESALLCTTTYSDCCSSQNPETQWYFPNGSRVMNDRNLPYYRTRSFIGRTSPTPSVKLHRNPEGTTTGIFRCGILDANTAIQSLYVGIYFPPSAPTITSAVSLSPTSIDISWAQSTEDVVIAYEIAFSYQGPCSGFTHTNTITVENTTMQHSLSGLQEFSSYTVSVTAVGVRNASATDVVTTLSSVPSGVPQAVRTNTSTFTNISIEWDRVDCTDRNSEIIGYIVRYRPVGGTAMNTSVSGSDSLSYTATGLTHSTNYSFEVAAESSNGVGPFSGHTTAQTTSASGPSAPIIEAVSLSPSSINLNWTQSTEDLVISYEITFSYQGPCSGYARINTTTVDGSSSTHTLSGLQEFSNYAISVTAVNDARSRTTTKMVTTLSAAPSGAPQTVRTNTSTFTNISIEWDRVDCSDRNSEMSGYIVRYRTVGGTAMNVSVSGSDSLSYTVTGLTHSTNYSFEVAAESSNGVGPFSVPTTAQTTSASAPSAPIIEAVSLSPTSINLDLTQPTEDLVISYEITFSYQGPCSGFTHTNTTTVDGSSSTHTLSGLQEFSNYTISVTAVNDLGNRTATKMVTTLSAVPSGAPQAVQALATSRSTIYVRWERVSCIQRNSEITGYTVHYASSNGIGTNTVSGTARSERAYSISGLTATTQYSITVAANNIGGTTGLFSSPITVWTPASAPSAPIIEGVSLSPTSINLDWTQPTEDVVISYEITFSYQGPCSGFTRTTTITVDGSSSTHTLSGLRAFSNYTISVTAVNVLGNRTATKMVTTLSAVPSGAPQAVQAWPTGRSAIYVQWGRVSCFRRNSEITGYTVRYASSDGVGTNTTSGTARSERAYSISGLTATTQYNIMIAANSIGGTTGPFSNPITVWSGGGLALNGVSYYNNSLVSIYDIGKGESALLCIATYYPCCSSQNHETQWYFPNGSQVLNDQNLPYQRTRSFNPGTVRLNLNSEGNVTGIFSCTILDANRTLQTYYVGIYFPPSAPTITSAVSLSPTSIDISWAQPREDVVIAYEITFSYQGPCSGFTHTNTITVENTTMPYSLSGLQEFSSYTVSVTAVGVGNASATDVVTTLSSVPSGAPQTVRTNTSTLTNISIEWDHVDCTDRNSEILGYVVRYRPVGGTAMNASVSGSDSLSYTATKLAHSTDYSFEVAAESSNGVGPFSVPTTAQTTSASGPSAPIIEAVSLSPTSINLNWIQPTEDLVISYEITFSYQGPCSGYARINTITVDGSSSTHTLSGLQEFSNYAISVTAVNDARSRTTTEMVSTLSAAPSGAPQTVRTSTSTFTNISIEWDRVDCTDRNSEISGYIVRYGPVGGTAKNTSVSGSDSLSYTATGLTHSTNYSFEVAAESSNGVGPFSVPTTAQTTSASAPSAPIIEAVSLSPTSINLNWTQSTEDLVVSYEITFSYQGPCSGFTHTNTTTVDGSSSTHTLSGLQEFSNYTVSVTAVNDLGNRTTTKMVTTLSAAPSGAPQAVQVLVTSRSTIHVQWDRVSCIQRNSEITGYTVRYASSNGVGTNTVSGTTRSEISGLTVNTTYNIMIAANNIGGTTGPFSNPITVWISGVGLTLNGVSYFNNSLVNINYIGTGSAALLCTTTYSPCCSSSNPETQWYFPNGSQVMNNWNLPYLRTRTIRPRAVRLNLNSEGNVTGIFSCTLFDANRTLQTLYVGIYFPPSAPTITSAVSLSPTSIDLNWTQPTEDFVINYEITFSYQGPCSGFTHTNTITVENTTMHYSLSGLQEFSNYTVHVTAVGVGNASATDVVTTLSSAPSGAPQTVRTNKTTSTTVTIEWDRVYCTDRNSEISGYIVRYRPVGGTAMSASVSGSDSLSYTATGLTHSTNYSFEVAAESSNGVGPFSVPTTAQTKRSSLTLEVTGLNAAIAGQTISLTCTVTRGENISVTPDMQWLGPDGNLLLNGDDGIMVDSTTMVSNSEFIRTLRFTPVQTSHGGLYTCQASVNERKAVTLNVQIAAPTVLVSVDTPTYSGTNTTLNCNITLSAAVDTVVDASWVNVAWTGPRGPISSNSSVAISDVTGSNNVYESILTFSPLMSTATGSYMCEAVINPVNEQFLLMSSADSGIETITVQDLPPPDISISSTGIRTAGEMFALTCSVTVVENVYTPPAVEWQYSNGSLITSGGNIQLEGPLIFGRISNLTLRFNRSRTSHGRQYKCQASITIPLAAISNLSNDSDVNVTIQVPPPQITITGSPRNDSFVAGVLLYLTCSIQLDPAVDTQISVTGMWNRSGTPLRNASHITVFGTSESTSTQLLYLTRVQFNPLSGTDGGLFACKAVVEPQTPHATFVLGTLAVYMRQISVTGEPPVPTVNITGDGDRDAGNMYVLTCKVTEELTEDAVITWLNSTGDPVNLHGVTVGEVTQRGNTTIQSLTFNPLRTSHGGEYICTAVISFFPQLIPDSSSNSSFAFSVLIPQPTVSVSLNRTGNLYAGTSLTLTCSIRLRDSVDTKVDISHIWTGPGFEEVTNNSYRTVSDVASVTTLMYVTTIELSPLSTMDSGMYTCQALVTPDPESVFVIMSMKESDTQDIRVKALPRPQVKIRTGGTSTAGEMYILTCTTVVEENLVVEPSVEWQYSNRSAIVGGNGISVGNPVTSGKTTNLTLTLDPLRTSHGGKYTCSATVTAKGITLSSNESVADVTVQISAPTVSISAVQPQPYNGTNFSLSCTITLDPTVDTTVNVTGTWLKSDFELTTNETTCITVSDTLQVMTNPSTYVTLLQFEPLGSNSTDGGSYICNATVVPYPDALFVTTTSRMDTHQLDVQALPLPVVSFKASSDQVVRDQRYTLTCIVQVVQFLANQPNVSWLNAGSSPLVGNGITVGQPMSNDNTTTLHFTIDQLGQSHEGRYTCQACISIDKVAIQGHCNSVTALITLEGEPPVPTVNITAFGDPVAGNNYVLTCMVTEELTEDAMITWLNSTGDPVNLRGITVGQMVRRGNTIIRRLTFNPLRASHGGEYICTAIVSFPHLSIPDSSSNNSFALVLSPSAPTITSAVSLSPTSIDLNWIQPTEDFVISYEITFSYQGRCSGFTHTNTITVENTTMQYSLSGLQEFSNYTVGVTAVGAGNASATDVVTTLSSAPNGAPQAVWARATGRSTIYVQWDRVNCIQRNSEITGYTVHYASSDDVGTNTTSGTARSERAYSISGLTATTQYTIRIAANSMDGTTGPFSNPVYVWTSGMIGLTLNGVSYFNNSLVNINDIGNGESALLCTPAYLPCCSSHNPETQWYFPNGSQVLNDQNLPYQRTRSFNPRAVRLNLNSEGNVTGFFSCTIFDANRTLQTLYVGIYFPPSAPTITSAVSLSPTSIDINWTQPTEDFVISYEITLSYLGPCSGSTHTNTITVDNATMQVSLSGLQEFSNYTVSVTAVGAGNASATDVVTTLSSGSLGITFNGTNIGNNSIVTLSDIGIGTSSLNCMTNNQSCSRRTNSSSVGVGHWYYPNGTQILNPSVLPNVSSGTSELPYYVTRDFLQVMLHRNREGSTTGIFRCDIPDATGTMQTFYVGIYHSNMGIPSVTSLRFNHVLVTLACISNGGPATTVTWMKDGVVISLNATYSQSQVVIDGAMGRYYTLLNITAEPVGIVGQYSCSVKNSRGGSAFIRTLSVKGLRITSSEQPLTLGEKAMFTCSTDLAVKSIQWLDSSMNTISNSSQQPLSLIFNPVNESIHSKKYTCKVTSPYGVQEEGITVNVNGSLGIMFNGTNIGNNSIVTLSDIGIGTSSLNCVTNSQNCSRRTNSSSVGVGHWYYPNGTQILNPSVLPIVSSGTSELPYYVTRDFLQVMLHRNSEGSTTGIFRCDIPDATGTIQTFCVGIYHSNMGIPSVTSLRFNHVLVTLTCISNGGPATTVTWMKDGAVISLNGTYSQSQVVIDGAMGRYYALLNITAEPVGIVGQYSCSVKNSRGGSPFIRTLSVKGLRITSSEQPLTLGEKAMFTCSTDLAVKSIQWLDSSMNTISNSSQQPLSLIFNPVNESIHSKKYTCKVTSPYGVQEEGITVNVNVPEIIIPSISMEGTPIAGQQYSLNCNITKAITGLTDVPTAQWMDSDGQPVTSINETTSTHLSTINTITFSPLRTSHGGQYTCRGTVQSPLLASTANVSITHIVTVAISAPSVRIEPPIFTGSNITLHCSITLNAAVDTGIATSGVAVTWVGPQGPITSNSRIPISGVTGSSTMYESTLSFYSLTIEDAGEYVCMATISPVVGSQYILLSDTGSDSETITVQVPSRVQNLRTIRVSDISVSIAWREPVMTNGIVNYTIEVREYTASTGGDVLLVPLNQEVKRSIPVSMLTAVDGEFMYTLAESLEPLVPYSVTVTADNLAGPGDPTDRDFFTREGEPRIPPRNVTVERLNGTAMNVSWVPLNLVEARGFVRSYLILYQSTRSVNQRKRQLQRKEVSGNAGYTTASDLQPGIPYDVMVSGVTVRVGPASIIRVPPIPDRTSSGGTGAVVGGIVAVLVLALLVIILMVVVVNYICRSRHKGSLSLKQPKKPKSKQSNAIQLLAFNTKEETKPMTAIRNSPVRNSEAMTHHMKPIGITSFRDHVQKMHSENNKGFDMEYQLFETQLIAAHVAASQPYNKPKNRFANILPYDSSRVKLNEIRGEIGSDYINACYMDGYNREKAYIASQGPLSNTIADFWRMIWEKRLPMIVMLTNCVEAGRVKCQQYWGVNIGVDFETSDNRLTITTTAIMSFADFEIRKFTVKSVEDPDAEPLSVTQYHFTSWPDHGVPRFPTCLIAFIRKVRKAYNKHDGYPLLVHCSAGVGRTGSFILLDSMLERIEVEDTVNVCEFLHYMRTQRFMMVQTLPQYIFVHDALDESITCKETSILAVNLNAHMDQLKKTIPGKDITGFGEQFQLLEEVSRQPKEGDFDDAQEYYNRDKNRYQDKLPYKMFRVHLRHTGEDGSDYINASFVDGYKHRNAYIATQAPLQSTVNDFWRMIWEFKSMSIVMMCNITEDNQETCYPYWPSKEGETVKYGKVIVTLLSSTVYDDFVVRKFSVQEDKGDDSLVAGFQVTQFHYIEWPEHGKMLATAGVIDVIDMLTKVQISTGNRAITVMCNDGAGRTGTFICIHSQLERLKAEREVDIFQSIKSARIQHAGLVLEEEQYMCCHEVLADYVAKFDSYANFKE